MSYSLVLSTYMQNIERIERNHSTCIRNTPSILQLNFNSSRGHRLLSTIVTDVLSSILLCIGLGWREEERKKKKKEKEDL